MSRVFCSTIMIWMARMPKPPTREDGADHEADDGVLLLEEREEVRVRLLPALGVVAEHLLEPRRELRRRLVRIRELDVDAPDDVGLAEERLRVAERDVDARVVDRRNAGLEDADDLEVDGLRRAASRS